MIEWAPPRPQLGFPGIPGQVLGLVSSATNAHNTVHTYTATRSRQAALQRPTRAPGRSAGEPSSRAPACLQARTAARWAEGMRSRCSRIARRPRCAQCAQVEAELATCAPTSNGTLSDSSVSEVDGAAKSIMRQCSRSAPMAGGSRSRWWSSCRHQQHLAPRDGRLAPTRGCTLHGRVQHGTAATTRLSHPQRPPGCDLPPAPAWLWSAEP